jgi:hypothetical protein
MPSTRSTTRTRARKQEQAQQAQQESTALVSSPGAVRLVKPKRANSKTVSAEFDKEVIAILQSPFRHLTCKDLREKFPATFKGARRQGRAQKAAEQILLSEEALRQRQ